MDRSGWPVWVRTGLWSIHSRGKALAYMVFCLGLALVLMMLEVRWLWVWAMVLAATWYWLALRWVDKNARWGE